MTTQAGNIVGGDQAGRDITKNYIFDATEPTPMRHLIERLKHERANDMRFADTLSILKRYTMPAAGETVNGLEDKLRAADRGALLAYAARVKEVFHKKLMENQFSEAGQEILAYLLAEIFTRFHHHVLPAIHSGESQQSVSELVQRHVIDPVQSMLGENPLHLYAEEVNGMLYYLTGNCHIRWVR
ncbi:MAG: hypothetical protein NT105_14005 [Verrucomicrobia bacterium]|nr:hypothetical protein [Verrucomicrobiota bacterium]